MEVRKNTLLRLLAKALAQKGVRLRTQHHAVKVGKLLNLLEDLDDSFIDNSFMTTLPYDPSLL